MGNTSDKEESAKTVGDQTVTIIENQEVHSTAHAEHAWKLNVILTLLAIQLAIALLKYAVGLAKKTLAKAATKAAFVQHV